MIKTTVDGRYQVVNVEYENAGGGIYVLIVTVYDKLDRATRYVLYNDDANQLVTTNFVFDEIDYDDSMVIATYCEEEHEAYNSTSDLMGDGETNELFEACWLEYIRQECQKFNRNMMIDPKCAPYGLDIPNDYGQWLVDKGLLLETDGEFIYYHDDYKETTVQHEPYVKELQELKEYMIEQCKLMNSTDEDCEKFYNMKATISFGNRIVTMDNCAAVFEALSDAIDYIISQE